MKNEITMESVLDIVGKANLEAYGVNPFEVTLSEELAVEDIDNCNYCKKLEVTCNCKEEEEGVLCKWCDRPGSLCNCDEQYMNYQDNNLVHA